MILSRANRLFLGIIVLLFVDIIWVASSELTEYIFAQQHFDKPFFSTYYKISMFVLYLSGFIFRPMWCYLCKSQTVEHDMEERHEPDEFISRPVYVPIGSERSSETESDEFSNIDSRSVRFSSHSEVRQLSHIHAEDANLARLSYTAYLRAEEIRNRMSSKMRIPQILKLSFVFSFVFFLGNLFYQEALNDCEASVVNVLSSTSSFFTLILAAIFPSTGSTGADKFTLSKFFSVILSISGIVLISVGDNKWDSKIPSGALWALGGALFYALYLVLLKRQVESEDQLNLPIFFGFIGLFTAICVWPGFFALHYSHIEKFSLPNKTQLILLSVNAIIGTVISDLMWLWGCFLTSSLIGTVSLSLTIPMSMFADTVLKNIHYGWKMYTGSTLVFLSFFCISILSHYESYDPCLLALRKFVHLFFRHRPTLSRAPYLDKEQTESLINSDTEHNDEDKCDS